MENVPPDPALRCRHRVHTIELRSKSEQEELEGWLQRVSVRSGCGCCVFQDEVNCSFGDGWGVAGEDN
ncbi:hypothetical protein NL676_001592 [Syzygium grande]|nr:hypothetical protein NL676_001592 [Syzygium grande]